MRRHVPVPATGHRMLRAASLTGLAPLAGPAGSRPPQAANRVTPGDFTGYGFDQCTAPTQRPWTPG